MFLKSVLVLLVLAPICSLAARKITNLSIEEISREIPKEDVFGLFIRAIDGFLSSSQRGRSSPESDQCETKLLKYAESELKLSFRPRGYCSYCCKMHRPSRYVRLFFFSKATGNDPVEIGMSKTRGALRSAGVRDDVQSVFFIHGFTEHGMGPSPLYIRDAYLSREEDFNIFLVDWGELTALPWYPQAVDHTKLLGTILARFIDFYHGTGELPIAKIHVVGFSLGAHAAGFIGKYLNGGRLPRISGLDPALPLFSVDDDANRLSKDDAEFVDVMHTDAGSLGFPISIGDADFYPNGGSFVQPGCEVSSLAERMYIEELAFQNIQKLSTIIDSLPFN